MFLFVLHRSNDAANDAAREQFKARQQTSNIFAQEQAAPPPPAQEEKPHKISNVFFWELCEVGNRDCS